MTARTWELMEDIENLEDKLGEGARTVSLNQPKPTTPSVPSEGEG